MSKKLTLLLDDMLHREVAGAAQRSGQSLHAWLLHAASHQVFRQLTDEARAWCEANPEHADEHATFDTALTRERDW